MQTFLRIFRAVNGIIATFALGTALYAGELPGWSPAPDLSNCSSCGGVTAELDLGTLLQIDLGPGMSIPAVGVLALRANEPSQNLCTPEALEISSAEGGGLVTTAELDLRYDPFGMIRQIATARLFIDISSNTAYQYTIRIMKKAAQGVLSNGIYSYNSSPSYLIRQFIVDNPDASATVYNRLRIRDVTNVTTEWMFTYSTSDSGWNVTLPTGLGFIDLISTVPSGGVWTQTKRYRNPAGQVIAQRTLGFKAVSWGTVLLTETDGIGAEARTRTYTYYETAGSVPFTPSTSLPAVDTVTEPDGSWRKVLTYDNKGRVVSELHGIDTAVTTTATLCRKVDYVYASQDAADDLTRQPRSPRRVDEYWKGTLVKRTYHVYAMDYHRTIECPDPANLIGDASNVVRRDDFDWGTSRLTKTTNPDGTIVMRSTSYGANDVKTAVIDLGQNSGAGTVLNGFRTEVVTSALGRELSQKKWAIVSGVLGPLVSSRVGSNLDDYGRPQRIDHMNGLFETFSFACCGLETHTDTEGVVTTYGYDALGRQETEARLNIIQKKVFDAASRVAAEKRTGTDGSEITQKTIAYDTSGLVIDEMNALSGHTTYSRTKPSGLFDRITASFPDTGTRIEDFDADGAVKLSGTAVFPVRYVRGLTTTTYGGLSRTFRSVQEIKLDAAGNDTSETIIRCQDGLDREVKTIYPAAAARYVYFNNAGQRVRETDADGVATLFQYNGQGELEITAVDVNLNNLIDSAGSDRITKTVTQYLATGASGNSRGMPIKRVDKTVWTTASSSAEAKTSTIETSLSALRTWRTLYKDQSTPVPTSVQTSYSGNARTETTTTAQGSYTVRQFINGRLTTVSDYALGGSLVTQTSYTYDTHGRVWKISDARNGTTTLSYNAADQVTTTVTPVPGTGDAAQTTTTSYNSSLRPYLEVQPDSTSVNREFYSTGLLKKIYGSRTYPVEYSYDAQGRMKTMNTWQNYSGGSGIATTTWNYDPARGWLTTKLYHAQAVGTEYTYTPGGRLKTRKWARTGTGGQRILTTYTYGFDDGVAGNDHPDLLTVVYANDPVGTPQVTYTYDRRGRLSTTSFNGMTTTHSYNDANLSTGESYTGGTLSGLSTALGYDNYLRRNSLSANTAPAVSQSLGYDNASRLYTASDGAFSSTYGYQPNSRLISTITHSQSGATRLAESRAYDFLNRVSSIQATPSAGYQYAIGYAYLYNDANQRRRATLANNSFWVYQFDGLGQVTSGKKYWSDGTAVAGSQYEYAFDTIGNRTSTKAGGDQNGLNLQSATYTPNLLNQYSQRTVPAVASVSGLADPAVSVTVNGLSVYRRNDYFWKEIASPNSSAPVWQSLNVQAGSSSTIGSQFVPKTPETYSHDLDGNVTADGRWLYTWDAENRLIRVIAATGVGGQQRLDFVYDAGGRRIRKTVWNNISGTDPRALDVKFIYDGWNLVAELDANNGNAVIRSYLWGADLSGDREGAGGVGGLLAVRSGTVCHFAAQDGNGNVLALVDGSNGRVSANYEYGPFGELIRVSGPMGKANAVRFSSKYQDDETGLSYYGFRYYSSTVGRWLSRDPKGERGSENLYGMVDNDPVRKWDLLGLEPGWGPPAIAPSMPYPGSMNPVYYHDHASQIGQIPEDWSDAGIFMFLGQRWTDGTGKGVTLSESAMQRMLGRGLNAQNISQFKSILKRRCKLAAKTGSAVTVFSESNSSPGGYTEAWYLGGHSRTLTVAVDCCLRKFVISLSVGDDWNFDEDVPYSESNWKNWGSWGFGGFVGFGAWWNVQSFPVDGSIQIEEKW